MKEEIQQHIEAEPFSQVTVIGTQYVQGAQTVSFVPAEVLRLSEEQCSAARRRVGSKYRSSLYVTRTHDSEVLDFVTSGVPARCKALVLTERAGSGKTNLLCRLSEQLPGEGFPCVFLLASDLTRGSSQLRDDAVSIFGITPLQHAIPEREIRAFLASTGKPFCILVDALNEARDLETLKQALVELLTAFADLPVRVLCTCRDIYWSFVDDEWTEKVDTAVRTLDMYRYDMEAWPVARQKYFDAYRMQGTLTGDADEKCRHPLLFKFFCEAYEGENISTVSEIRLKPLFERYLSKKVRAITRGGSPNLRAEEQAVRILMEIASAMLESSELSVPEHKMPYLTRDADYLARDSLYVRLLDEDIMIEEVPVEGAAILQRRVRFVYEAFLEFMLAKSLEEKWASVTDEEVLSSLEGLLEPSACVRNVIGALSYLNAFFTRRGINPWKAFTSRGPVWENIVVQAIAETDPKEFDDLHRDAFRALLDSSPAATRASVLQLLRDPERRQALDGENKTLLDRLQRDTNSAVRCAAYGVLMPLWGSLTEPQRLVVAEAVLDRSSRMRSAARESLDGLGAESAAALMKRLRKAMSSPNAPTRSYAAAALSLDRWPHARRLLVNGLSDEYHWVRSACLINLKDHPSESDAASIVRLLDDPVARVRSLAAIVCAAWLSAEMYQPLTARVRVETDGAVLSRILTALAGFGDTRTLPIFQQFLSHPHYWVFYQAGRGLLRLSGVEGLEQLLKVVIDRGSTVWRTAWPKSWDLLQLFGGVEGIADLCYSGFRSGDVSISTAASVAGIYMPECAFPAGKNSQFLDWASDFLRRGARTQRRAVLQGLCLTTSAKFVDIVCDDRFRAALHDLILQADDPLAGLGARVLARAGLPLDRDEYHRIFSAVSPGARLDFARGLCIGLRRGPYQWITEPYQSSAEEEVPEPSREAPADALEASRVAARIRSRPGEGGDGEVPF